MSFLSRVQWKKRYYWVHSCIKVLKCLNLRYQTGIVANNDNTVFKYGFENWRTWGSKNSKAGI